MQQENKTYTFDIIEILSLLYKWKFTIVIVCGVSALAAYIFTGPAFITPKYKATCIMYPTANSSFSQSLIDPNYITQKKPLDYGEKEEGEQLMQILNSDEIAMRAIRHYKLYEHYGFDTTKYWSPTIMKIIFRKHVDIERTDYMAIKVEALDKDPKFAMYLAAFMCDMADQMKNEMYKQKAKKSFEIAATEYNAKQKQIDSLNKILTRLRKDGVYEYYVQVEALYEQWVKTTDIYNSEKAKLTVYKQNRNAIPDSTVVKTEARMMGAQASLKSLEPALHKIGQYGGSYMDLMERWKYEQEKLTNLQQSYEQARIDYLSDVPQKYVVSPSDFPDMPSTPRRLLITFITGVAMFFVSVGLVIFFEKMLPAIRERL